jgi:hypothetical protein
MFARLGFAVTPRSRLPGLSNRLICFAPSDQRGASFIELLSIDDRSRASPTALDLLSTGSGPIAAVVCSADVLGLLQKIGDDRIELRDIARTWELPNETLTVHLATLNVPSVVSPFGWAAIEHHTPQHYRIPRFVEHPNGVTGLRAIIAVADEPQAVGLHFQELWQGELRDYQGGVVLRIGTTELRIYSQKMAIKRYGVLVQAGGVRLLGAVLTASDSGKLPTHLGGLRITEDGEAYLPAASPEGALLAFTAAA